MHGVSKITSAENIMQISYTGAKPASLPRVLGMLADANVVVDMISQTAAAGNSISFSFTAPFEGFDTVIRTLGGKREDAPSPMISGGYSKLNLFGEDMVDSVGVAARALQALQDAEVEVAMITTSDLDISLLLRQEDEDQALQALRAAFAL